MPEGGKGRSTGRAGNPNGVCVLSSLSFVNLNHIGDADHMVHSIGFWAAHSDVREATTSLTVDIAEPEMPACASRKRNVERVSPHDAILGSASLALLARFEFGSVHTDGASRSVVHLHKGRFLAP